MEELLKSLPPNFLSAAFSAVEGLIDAGYKTVDLKSIKSLCQVALFVAQSHVKPQQVVNGQQLGMLEHARLCAMTSKLPLSLQWVDIRPSPVHGRGVFASVPISKGTVVTMYPAHVASYRPDGQLHFVELAKNYSVKQNPLSELRDYLFTLDPSLTWAIYGSPDLLDRSYLGHMINDAARPGPHMSEAEYELVSQTKANVEFVPVGDLAVAIVATKDIAANQELFVYYTQTFWASRK